VNSRKDTFNREKAASWLAGLTTLAYILSRFVPCTPPSQYVIDDFIDNDWSQILHVAFAQHLQFGRDIVFTYGPWGFLARGFYPPTYHLSVFVWVILSLIFWRASWRLAHCFSSHLLLSSVWIIALTAFASIPVGDDINVRFVAFAVLLLSLHFFEGDRWFTPTRALLVVSLGLLSLIKFTALLQAVIVVTVIATDIVWRHRRFPWVMPLLAASLLVFWIAAGQHLRWLGPFLIYSRELTSGYTEAMMRTTVKEASDISYFFSVAALLFTLMGNILWKRHRFGGVLALVGMCGILAIIFKQGYVRHDMHEISATTSLSVISLICLAMAWTQKQPGPRLASLFVLVAAATFASFVFSRCFSTKGLPRQLAETLYPQRILAPMRVMFSGFLQQEHEKEFASLRSKQPLSMVDGDVYVYGQTVLFANGVPYRPRPVFHGYSAYTPELAELNTSHLRGDRAAHNLLFAIKPIDSRLPSLEDGRSWPELLTLYDVKGNVGPFLLLTRAGSPRNYRLTLLQTVSARFGEKVTLPSRTDGAIWAEFDIRKSWVGTLVTTIYKPSTLTVTIMLANGEVGHFRLVPGLARSGFLLSPLIHNTAAFAALASKEGSPSLAGLEVSALTISAVTESGSTVCYKAPMQLRFYQLSTQNVSD